MDEIKINNETEGVKCQEAFQINKEKTYNKKFSVASHVGLQTASLFLYHARFHSRRKRFN